MDEDVYSVAEAGRCLLCNDAPCTKVCGEMDVGSIVRSIRFRNTDGAASRIWDPDVCLYCSKKNCLRVCNRAKVDRAVDIPFLIGYAARNGSGSSRELPSLAIDFCGVRCENPFVIGSSVVTGSFDRCRRALEAGWGGVAVKTICSLEINETSPRFEVPDRDEFPFSGFKNMEQLSPNTPEFDFAWMRELKEMFPSKLVIASIMGKDEAEWESLSAMAQEAGADIIECNFSCPQMVGEDLGSDIGQNPAMVECFTRACTRGSDLPVIAKLTPNLASPDDFVEAAYRGGAAGISGINTIKSLMTVDLRYDGRGYSVQGRTAVSGYSGKAVKPIALRFVRDSYRAASRSTRNVQISGIGGIESWNDALDFMLLGCRNLQVCTAVMQYGFRIIDDLTEGLQLYMQKHGIRDLDRLVGRSLPSILDPDDLVRGKVVRPVFDHARCISCGRCYISCRDAGHDAIQLVGRKPLLLENRCVGCHLCRFVCIVGAIGIDG